MNKVKKRQECDTLSDEAIIELYWKRNENAIAETDKKYKRYLYRIAYNILHDKMDCEECLNDTYMGTWSTIPPQRPSVFQAFLSKIMRNTAVTKYKRNTASKRVPSEMTISLEELSDTMPYALSAEEEHLLSEVSRIISEYLRSIPERSAFIFICRYYCSDKISDIADMLHISDRTVFRDLTEIREGLKERLIKEGYDLG